MPICSRCGTESKYTYGTCQRCKDEIAVMKRQKEKDREDAELRRKQLQYLREQEKIQRMQEEEQEEIEQNKLYQKNLAKLSKTYTEFRSYAKDRNLTGFLFSFYNVNDDYSDLVQQKSKLFQFLGNLISLDKCINIDDYGVNIKQDVTLSSIHKLCASDSAAIIIKQQDGPFDNLLISKFMCIKYSKTQGYENKRIPIEDFSYILFLDKDELNILITYLKEYEDNYLLFINKKKEIKTKYSNIIDQKLKKDIKNHDRVFIIGIAVLFSILLEINLFTNHSSSFLFSIYSLFSPAVNIFCSIYLSMLVHYLREKNIEDFNTKLKSSLFEQMDTEIRSLI
ncbi:hypothetical protein K7J14_14665 [Treponema zuelzerae]|uniref:Uncharacterized protein n=1 Tax=Teretinema zuelzerae TaxID=156 RepID=A0AAE3EMC6_9SPIR|nr:hypothetical protein [Teretinema zuelzerae]MCD1655939.1 hypothetical protein [Teretinema zuelzerae]